MSVLAARAATSPGLSGPVSFFCVLFVVAVIFAAVALGRRAGRKKQREEDRQARESGERVRRYWAAAQAGRHRAEFEDLPHVPASEGFLGDGMHDAINMMLAGER